MRIGVPKEVKVLEKRVGLTPGSVRVNLHRGLKLLREKLGLEGQAHE